MNKYAVIENGVVTNIVISDPDFAQEQGWVACDNSVSIGFDYVDGSFVDNRPPPVSEGVAQPSKEELLNQLESIRKMLEGLPQ